MRVFSLSKKKKKSSLLLIGCFMNTSHPDKEGRNEKYEREKEKKKSREEGEKRDGTVWLKGQKALCL